MAKIVKLKKIRSGKMTIKKNKKIKFIKPNLDKLL